MDGLSRLSSLTAKEISRQFGDITIYLRDMIDDEAGNIGGRPYSIEMRDMETQTGKVGSGHRDLHRTESEIAPVDEVDESVSTRQIQNETENGESGRTEGSSPESR